MQISRCDLLPQDCVTDHLCPVLDARPQAGNGWRARCPAHDDEHPSLTLNVGTRGARIVWTCHRGCAGLAVRTAMLARGVSAGCLGPVRQPTRPAEPDDDLRARIEKLITSPPTGLQRLRIEIAMELWECDRHTAASKLGIGWRTAYRARTSR